ncbi:MAG: glycosyltransferase family 4 protein [Clostridiales bacterium]|nr:glycosyltransferase family 4 protein [Clostridiales bacterium]
MKLRNDSFYGKIASLLNYLVFPLTLMSAHGVLVRGKTTLGQSLRWNKNTILSNPLISYKHFNKSIDREEKKDDDSWSLLFVGKLEKNKGVHVLIKALAIILEKCRLDKPVGLHIVGSGPMEGELRLLVAKYGIADSVHFYGFVDNADKLKSLFAMSDVFVVPTLYHEGFPRVIDEAMACGLPVICSEIGGMKDGLEKDEVFFVEAGDAERLTDAIMEITGNEILRKDFQESSNRRARKILQSTATEQHIQFLASLNN